MKAALLALALAPALCCASGGTFTCATGEVARIRTAPGFLAVIAFRSDVTDFATGFSSAWELAARGPYLFLKPRAAQGRTNLAVRTRSGLCLFDLEEAEGTDPTYLLTEAQPPAEARKAREAASEERKVAALLAAKPAIATNRAYTMTLGSDPGSRLIAPEGAFDDGLFTTLTFAPGARLPAAFACEGDAERVIASHVDREGRLVLHGIYRELRLRLGGSVVGVRNEAYGRGRAARRGTSVPGLAREALPPQQETTHD